MLSCKKLKWTVYLLHHSHTDIGYTDSQEEITEDHIHYIKEACDLANDANYPGFKWVCETLWGVEIFLDSASAEQTRCFVKACHDGKISLSGSYLNMTEAIDGDILRLQTGRIRKRLSDLGIEPAYAMTSDVNGYAWGYADLMSSFGIKGLISQINSTHGHEPLDRRQTPFI